MIQRRLVRRPSSGQIVLAALIGLYFLALYTQDWYWPRFGVPAVPDLPFVDIRFLTTAWECTRDGLDVFPRNLCDPHGMRFNDHPRIWLAPAFFGLGESSTFALGLVIGSAFLLAVFAAIGNISTRAAFLYAALLCSPSVMLGVERANTDLIVFVIVVSGVLLAGRGTTLTTTAGSALLFFAAVLKLYPAFAWGALLRRPLRRALVRGVVMSIAFGAYLLATLEDLRAVREHFPRRVPFSYGAPVFAEELGSDRFGGQLLVVVTGCMLAAALIAFAKRSQPQPWQDRDTSNRPALFLAGAGIYVGSYAATYNFNYRLIFLLLTVPYLLRSPRVPYPKGALTLILLALWLGSTSAFYPFGIGEWWADASSRFPYDELVNWLLFAYLAAAFVLTVEREARPFSEPAVVGSRAR
ncbi:MAG: hypothetical protein ABI783_11720 [Actinomycetota bacterium]